MFHIPMVFSWSTGLADGITTFTTIFNAVMDNALMAGVVMAGIAISLMALLWGVFKRQ